MNTTIKFAGESEQDIKDYLKGKCMFVMIDEDSNNVCAILKRKTFFDKLPIAIQEDTNCEEIKSIELNFSNHAYCIVCKCVLIQDGDEEEKTFEINRTVVY